METTWFIIIVFSSLNEFTYIYSTFNINIYLVIKMWITVSFVVLAAVIYFLRSVNSLKKETIQMGGMSGKYKVLLKLLLAGDSRAKIYKESSTVLVLGAAASGASTKFEIFQGFGAITVNLTIESNVFGITKLSWDFKDDLPQEKMFEIISNDIYEENKKLP